LKPFRESGELVLQRLSFLTYHPAGDARVFCTGHPEPRKLEDWLQLEDGQDDHVILIPFENKDIYQSQRSLEQLTTKWNVPGAIMRHLLKSVGGNHLQKTGQGVLWKSWTIPMATYYLDNPISYLAIGSATDDPTAPLRVLAFIDRKSLKQVEAVITTFVSANHGAAPADLRSLWMQSLFLAATVSGWHDLCENFITWARGEVRKKTLAKIKPC